MPRNLKATLLPVYHLFLLSLPKTLSTTLSLCTSYSRWTSIKYPPQARWSMVAFNPMKRSLSPALSVRCIQNRTYMVLLEPERSSLLSGLRAAALENTTLQLPFPHHQKSLLRCTGLSQSSHILYVTWCFLATSPPRGTSFHQGFLFLCSLTEKP